MPYPGVGDFPGTPVVTGQLTLADYDDELVARGFDGIDQRHRFRIINLAYRRIARRFPWLWEKANLPITINPPTYALTTAGDSADLLNFRELDYIYITNDANRRKLRPVNDREFYEYWLTLDLAAPAPRGTPQFYKIENNLIYLLPPPQTTTNLWVMYHRRPGDMTLTVPGSSDVPVTPPHLDEAILLAAISGAHKRVYETQLAAQAEVDLSEIIGQMLEDEDWQDPQNQERVEPDNTWL